MPGAGKYQPDPLPQLVLTYPRLLAWSRGEAAAPHCQVGRHIWSGQGKDHEEHQLLGCSHGTKPQ